MCSLALASSGHSYKERTRTVANKSKIKGTTFENKVKKILTDHFEIKFERVPLSGALDYLKGDIWCPTKYTEWEYCIECKHYKELNFNNLLTSKSNDLWSFWQQAIDEAKVMNKKPAVIFKWDRGKEFVMWFDEIEVDSQMHIKAFGHEVKIAELTNWLPKIKLN